MIPGILQLNSKTIYGLTSRNVPIYRFKPLNTNLPDHLVGCSLKDRSKNMIALVQKSEEQRTNLIRLIGPCGDLKSEKEGLLIQHSSLNWKKFDDSNLVYPKDERRIVNGFTFNIDPEGCVDIDDTITIGFDGYVYITIADVAIWMVSNPDLFSSASKIGQTLYENGKVVSPLLPIEKHCSLFPNQERLGVALKFKWKTNTISDIEFEKVKIINNQSFTYDSIYKSTYSNIIKRISSYLAGRELNDSHEWIEQLMIFYNCEAAKLLVNKKQGILRTQDPPEIEKINHYKNFVTDVSYLANKAAKYVHAHTESKHWGLSKDIYCHASSPIRRFSDIVNQMVICDYKIPQYDVDELNKLQKDGKKYERDLFFLEKLLETENRSVEGIVLNDHRVWVPEWKRIITCKNSFTSGTTGILKYSLDMNQPTWKRRMVFKFEDTNCQE
jgi:exoribonuclease R